MTGTQADPGVIPRAVRDVFRKTEELADNTSRETLVRVSFLEIYNEDVRDLLDVGGEGTKLAIREEAERGVFVAGLREHIVTDADAALALMEKGNKNRATGETAMNKRSSRSHSIYRLVVESAPRSSKNPGKGAMRYGTLTLVDLAGSERVRKAQTSGDRLREGASINKSLLTLGTVINKLTEGVSATHIPFRDSKLTRILAPSLGGNAKTTVICNIATSAQHFSETLSTLRFAARAKKVKNFVRINEVISSGKAILQQKMSEISRIRWKLATSAATLAARAQAEREVTRMRQEILEARRKNDILQAQIETEKDTVVEKNRAIEALKSHWAETFSSSSAVRDNEEDQEMTPDRRVRRLSLVTPGNPASEQDAGGTPSSLSPSLAEQMVGTLRARAKQARARSRWRVAFNAVTAGRHRDAASRLVGVAVAAAYKERQARKLAEQQRVLAEQLKSKLTSVEQQLKGTDAQLDAARSAWAQREVDAAAKAAEESQRMREARLAKEAAERSAGEANAKLLEASQALEGTEGERKSLARQLEDVDAERVELIRRLAEADAERAALSDKLKHSHEASEAAAHEAARKLEKAEAAAAAAASRCGDLTADLREAMARTMALEAAQSEDSRKSAQAISAESQRRAEAEAKILRLEEDSGRLEAELADLRRRLQEMSATALRDAESRAEADAAAEDASRAIAHWQTAAAEAAEDLETARERLASTEVALSESQVENARTQGELDRQKEDLHKALRQLRAELESLRHAAATAQDEGEREREALRAALACAGSDADSRGEELAAAQEALAASRRDAAASAAELAGLRSRIEETERALANATDAIHARERDLADARSLAEELAGMRVRAEVAEASARTANELATTRERELMEARANSATEKAAADEAGARLLASEESLRAEKRRLMDENTFIRAELERTLAEAARLRSAAAAASVPLKRAEDLEAALHAAQEEASTARAGETAAIARASAAEASAASAVAERAKVSRRLDEESMRRRAVLEEERAARIEAAFAAEEEKARMRVRLAAAEGAAEAAAGEALGLHRKLHKVAYAVDGLANGTLLLAGGGNNVRVEELPVQKQRNPLVPPSPPGHSPQSPPYLDWAHHAAASSPAASPSSADLYPSVLHGARELQEHLDAIYRLSDGQRCPADVFGAVARAQEPTPASAAEDTTRLAAARGPSPRGSGPGGDL